MVIFWPFKSAYCEKKFRRIYNTTTTQSRKLIPRNLLFFDLSSTKIDSAEIYALKVIKVSDQMLGFLK